MMMINDDLTDLNTPLE